MSPDTPARIAVTGIGLLAPTGITEQEFWQALVDGRSALAAGTDGHLRAAVGEFAPKRYLAAGTLRRTPRLVQMTLVAAKLALTDAAGLPRGGEDAPDVLKAPAGALGIDPTRIGVVLGTGLGTFDQTMDFLLGYLEGGPEAASPLLFPTSVMNAAAGLLAVECGLRGVNSTVNHKDASPLQSIGMAIDLLQLGRADAIVVGAIEELCEPILEGYRLLGGLSKEAMRPYDRERSGIGLGESAAVLVLERLNDARARGARVRAILGRRAETSEDRPRIGWGEGRRSAETVRCLTSAIDGAPPIDWIAGSGNGTRLDGLELDAVASAFAESGRLLPPLSSILAHTGDSAASGLLRVVAAIHACEEGRVPSTLGLREPIEGYPGPILVETQRGPVGAVLVPSFGQGGSNVAIVVEHA